jgi:hypothetical protein
LDGCEHTVLQNLHVLGGGCTNSVFVLISKQRISSSFILHVFICFVHVVVLAKTLLQYVHCLAFFGAAKESFGADKESFGAAKESFGAAWRLISVFF